MSFWMLKVSTCDICPQRSACQADLLQRSWEGDSPIHLSVRSDHAVSLQLGPSMAAVDVVLDMLCASMRQEMSGLACKAEPAKNLQSIEGKHGNPTDVCPERHICSVRHCLNSDSEAILRLKLWTSKAVASCSVCKCV